MKKGLLLVFLCILSIYSLKSQSDNASNYGSAWSGNGGSGFSDWSFNSTGDSNQAGTFLGQTGSGNASDSNGNGDNSGDGDINTGGKAWGLYANSGQLSEAFRFFNTDMDTDDRFTVSMDIGFIDGGSTVGFAVQTDLGNNLLEVFFIGGDSFFTVSDGDGNTNSTIGFTDEGVTIQIEITANNAGTYAHSITITALDGGGSYNKTGNFSTSGQVGKIRFFNANAGSNGSNNLYFNSISHEIDALPVELTSFSAFAKNDDVELLWETSSEINNSHFEIQHSIDGRIFETIGQVQGLGTSNYGKQYQFTHNNPVRGNNYYRLHQVDFDGKSSTSEIVSVNLNTELEVQYFPNPLQDELTILWTEELENSTLELLNANGQRIYSVQLQESISIPTANLPKGVYFLSARKDGNVLWTEKVVK
jgi:hypothetical protein